MVNLVAVHRSLLHCLMKIGGIVPHTLEIEPGTLLNIWAPLQTPNKPAVLLLHGFAGDGIYNWQFQVTSLRKKYNVYVPDLLFFGGSVTDNPDRSVGFQAECVVKGLRKLGVGFSYGGLQDGGAAPGGGAGAVPAMTDSISAAVLEGIGFSSFSECLLPNSVQACKKLCKIGAHTKPCLPDFLYNHFIKLMIKHREERAKATRRPHGKSIPKFSQRIHLLWGEEDQIFNLQLAQSTKRELGEKATFQGIKKAGHLDHLERPCVYNRCLNLFLASLQSLDEAPEYYKQ